MSYNFIIEQLSEIVYSFTVKSKVFQILTYIRQERPNERYRNTVKDLLLPNTVRQKDEKPHTAGLDDTPIPPIKIKITKIYRLKESSIPQYRKLTPMSPSVREKWVEVWDTGNLKTALYHTLAFRAFSLTWPASMLIYWNKRKFLHKKRVQPPQDWFGTPT